MEYNYNEEKVLRIICYNMVQLGVMYHSTATILTMPAIWEDLINSSIYGVIG